MRIIWVSHKSGPGGAESSLVEAVAALSDRGHEQHVVIPRAGPLREAVEPHAEWHVIPHNPWVAHRVQPLVGLKWQAYNRTVGAPAIATLSAALDADLIVTNTITVPSGAMAAQRAGIPHVCFVREYGREDHDLRFLLSKRLSMRMMRRWTGLFLFNSEALRQHYEPAIGRAQARVVRAAVEIPDDRAAGAVGPQDRFRLVVVGTKQRGKGQVDAVRVVPMLLERGCDVELELVGAEIGDYAQELRRIAAQAGVTSRVQFVEQTSDPYSHLARASLALVCSRSEAFGRSTVEAMKFAKPVIGAAAGGTRELIRDGWNGLLYTPGDVEGLADLIERMYRQPDQLRVMGLRAMDWATRSFDSVKYGADLEDALSQVRRAGT